MCIRDSTYTAKSKKTGTVESFDKTTWELYKKMGASADYTDFKTETTKSLEQELYETNAALMVEADKNEEALGIIEKGLKKFPNSARLSEIQGTAFYKSWKTNEFISNLKTQIQKHPEDANNWYNLGVLQSKDPASASDCLLYTSRCV